MAFPSVLGREYPGMVVTARGNDKRWARRANSYFSAFFFFFPSFFLPGKATFTGVSSAGARPCRPEICAQPAEPEAVRPMPWYANPAAAIASMS
jgi:hypothetical protein